MSGTKHHSKTTAFTRVSHKLLVISLLLMVPASLMLYLTISSLNANIDFARLEQDGNRYQRPLMRLLHQIGDHDGLLRMAHDRKLAINSDQVQAAQVGIDATVSKLLAVDAEIGATLHFTTAGLAKRNREHFRAQTIAAEWAALKSELPRLDAQQRADRHRHLITDLRTMITHVGDQSNLILDPDLDSYYLMDVTLLALPQNLERLGNISAFGQEFVTRGNATLHDRIQVHVDTAMLTRDDRDRVLASIATSLQEDDNYYGPSPTLPQRLAPLLTDYRTAIDAFAGLCLRLAGDDGSTVGYDEFAAAGEQARMAAMRLWEPAVDELDVLLQRRIDHYLWIRLVSLVTAGLTLAASLILVMHLIRSVTRPLRQQAADLDAANVALKLEMAHRSSVEAQLLHAQKMESIGQLAAGVAHEINTPIQFIGDNLRFLRDSFGDHATVLDAHAKLLAAARSGAPSAEVIAATDAADKRADIDYLAEEIPKALGQSLEGLTRVAEIVRAMKEFAHPDQGERKPTDLNQVITTTLTVARNEYKYVADLITDFASDLPPVPCLAGEFNQVVINLLVNAAHAIGDVVAKAGGVSGGKGTITVSTRRDGDHVEVRIRDTGTGIPEAARAKIFDPFFTTKAVGKGTGQGLHIAHTVVVKKHGGTLTFETELGKGTTFIIRLPITP